IHPDASRDDWLLCCAEAGVLEVRDQEWRFAHDKLREQLLEDLALAVRRELHRGVAEAIERTYPGQAAYVTGLAHHWQQAADAAKEAEYAHRAGVLALQSGACREAIVHLGRALELMSGDVEVADRATRLNAGPRGPRATRTPRFSLLDPNARLDPDSAEFRLGMLES